MKAESYNVKVSNPISAPPEFYDAEKARQKYLSAGEDKYVQRTKNRKISQLHPELYLLQWHEQLKKECDQMRKLCEMFVTIHRYFRGVTISDQWGYFGTRIETQGRWIDYDPDVDGEVHPINIVRPDIRANNAALLQISPSIDVEPVNKSARNAENARRIQAMVDFFGRSTWTEADRSLIFDGIQKEGTNLLENYKEKCASQKVFHPRAEQTLIASYRCAACGSTGKKELSADAMPTGDNQLQPAQPQERPIPCPKCGGEALGMIEPKTNHTLEERELPTYEIKHRIWSGFNFLVDRLAARRGGIKTARYLRLHEPVSRAELE